MKKDTLFGHKEAATTCEESIGDTNEYQKLLEKLQPSRRRLAKEGG